MRIKTRIMLATGFNLCQGNGGCGGEVSQLPTGPKDIASTAFPNECVETGAAKNLLEQLDGIIRWAEERTSGKRIEGDQIDLAANPS